MLRKMNATNFQAQIMVFQLFISGKREKKTNKKSNSKKDKIVIDYF